MAENKTKANDGSVADFIAAVENDQRREDCSTLLALMEDVTGEEPKMWGSSIVGFGSYHYKYESGREGDMLAAGFSPRKQALTLYIMGGFSRYEEFMNKLGKYKNGKSCLYVKNLADVDLEVLRDLVRHSYDHAVKHSKGS